MPVRRPGEELGERPVTRVAALLNDAGAAIAAALGATAHLLDRPRLGLLLLSLALVGVLSRLVVASRTGEEGWSPLGEASVVRMLIIGGVAVAFGVAGDPEPWVAATAAAVLIGVSAVEPLLRRASRFEVPVVAHLPGIRSVAPTPDLGVPVVAAGLAASALGLFVALFHGSAWWWLLAAGFAAVPAGGAAFLARRKVLLTRQLRRQLPAALRRYAPEFAVYTSRPDDASYQVTMWLPYLKRAGLRFVIITRNSVPAAALANLTEVPVIEARRMSDLDGVVPPSLKAAFYVNASSGNGAFVRFQHLTHIYLGHGDSDKPPSYNPTHAMYDQIFAAGPAAARRYAAHGVRIPAEKFRIVGRPQVEDVQPATGPIGEVAEPVVLYAPTWRGHVEETMLYSLPSGDRIVQALLARGATVIFRPHPFSYDFADDTAAIRRIQQLLAADAQASGRRHLWGAAAETQRGILDCINASDAMVSDVSSVVSDYLFSGKPFAMVAVPAEPAAFVEEYPVARASYVIRGDLANLEATLERMLSDDPLAGQRTAIRVDYLGDFPAEGYAAAFVDAVRHVSTKAEVDIEEDPADAETAEPRPGGRGWAGYRSIIRSVGVSLLATGFAALTLAAALTGAGSGLIAGLGLLTLLTGLVSGWPFLTARRNWPQLLGQLAAPHALVLVAVLLLAARRPLELGPVGLAVALLAASLAVEPRVAEAWGRVGLEVADFPEVRAEVTELVPRGLLPLASTAAVAAGLAVAALGLPPWLLLLASASVFALLLDVAARALLRAARVVAAEHRLREALIRRAPQFAVYFASTVGAAYQIGMWLPYFVRIDRPFIIVVRTVGMLQEIAHTTHAAGVAVPIIHRPTLRSLEEVIVPSMTTAFYVNNAVRNTHFIERRELTHVWLNHGDSEKPACYNPVHAIYDLIFAAGQAGIDRYARHGVHIPAEKFRIVGRPQVEVIAPARGPIAEQAAPTVLYAPTWQGHFADTRVYSLPQGKQIVARLLQRGARVIFRAHPFNYRYPESVALLTEIGRLLARDRDRTGTEHRWGAAAERQMSVEDCFNASDAMVADVSAVVSDYLQSGKPFAIVSVGRTPEQLLVDAPAARAAYVLREDLSNLDQVCTDLLSTDPLAAVRRETKIYYLGDFDPDRYADGFLTAAREVIDAPVAGRATPV